MLPALLALVLSAPAGVGDRDPDPLKLPGEAERAYRLGLFDAAEKELRARLADPAADEYRAGEARCGLLRVLTAARKYHDAAKEADALLLSSKDTGVKAFCKAVLAVCRWKLDDPGGAESACAEALLLEEAYELESRSPGAKGDGKRRLEIPAVRPIVARVTGFLDWKRAATDHIVIWTPPDGAADPELAGRRLDVAFETIAPALGVAMEGRIEVFLFTDQRQADRILGQPANFSVPRERLLYGVAGSPLTYELAEVLSFHVANAKGKERPRTALLREGAAAAFAQEPLWIERVADLPRKLLRQGVLPPLDELAVASLPDATLRSCAGSFVQFLVRKRGKEAWVRLWTEFNDHEDPWTAVLGKTLAGLEEDWQRWLRQETP